MALNDQNRARKVYSFYRANPVPTATGGTIGIAGGDPGASYIVVSLTGSLPNERALTAGSGISIVDGGANGNITISAIAGSTNGWVDGAGQMKTTGSISIDASNRYAGALGSDVFFFVSGSTGISAGTNRKVSVMGGDVVISGTLAYGGTPALVGDFRVPSVFTLQARRADNLANVAIMSLSTDNLSFGDTQVNTLAFTSANWIAFNAGTYMKMSAPLLYLANGAGLSTVKFSPDAITTRLDFIQTTAAFVGLDTLTTDTVPGSITLQAQAPYASATGTNRDAGDIIVNTPASVGGSVTKFGGLQVQCGGTPLVRIGAYGSISAYGAIWFKDAGTPNSTNWAFLGESSSTYFNAPSVGGTMYFGVGASYRMTMNTSVFSMGVVNTSPQYTFDFSATAVQHFTVNATSAKIVYDTSTTGAGNPLTVKGQDAFAGASPANEKGGQLLLAAGVGASVTASNGTVVIGTSVVQTLASDVAVFVSGSTGIASGPDRHVSVFGGDVVASGSINVLSSITATGSISAMLGLSGSLTKLTNGTSYLVAGTNVTIASASNGQVTISSTATGGGGATNGWLDGVGKMKTTGSISIDASNRYADAIGTDVFLYVSGSTGVTSGPNRHVSVFGGDVVYSGSLQWSSIVSVPSLTQADAVTNSVTGSSLTVQAQNATGISTVGGTLVLKPGTGNTRDGQILLGTSGSTVVLSGALVGSSYTVTGTYICDQPNGFGGHRDYMLFVDTSVARSITLPKIEAGRMIEAIDILGSGSTNNVTFVRSGSVEKINGVAGSYVGTTNWFQYRLRSDGINWYIAG